MLALALPALALADCPTSLDAERTRSTRIEASARSCWGAFGRDRDQSQADVRAWLGYWERAWIGAPLAEEPGKIRYGASGSLGPCGWSAAAEVTLAADGELDSWLQIDLDPVCGPFLARVALRRVEALGRPFAAEWREGSAVPGAF